MNPLSKVPQVIDLLWSISEEPLKCLQLVDRLSAHRGSMLGRGLPDLADENTRASPREALGCGLRLRPLFIG